MSTIGPGRLGPWELLAPHARGGMSVVWEGHHTATGERVAIKVATDNPLAAASLRHEIWALRRLNHVGVVHAKDHGEHNGIPWMVLEWLESRRAGGGRASDATLHELLDETNTPLPSPPRTEEAAWLLPVDCARAIAGELCTTLAYLHRLGVAHCDLKPDNIMSRRDGQTVLVDFGLWAHAHGTPPRFDPQDRRALTRDVLARKHVAGTVAYVAPETLAGRVVDARADLYSLGCILYELLTGGPPFSGDVGWVIRRHQSAVPTPPRDLREEIGPDLNALVMQLLEKEPGRRPGFASEVAEHLLHRPVHGGTYVYRAGVLVGHAALRDELAGHDGGLSLVYGEAGAGRTRLALEVAETARTKRVNTFLHAFPEHNAAPLEGLDQVLERVCVYRTQHHEGDPWPVAALVPFHPPLGDLRDARQDLPAASPEERRLRVFISLHDVLSRLGRARPFLLVMDDLQWADSLTLSFLEWLGDRELDYRVVGTVRRGAGARADGLEIHAGRSVELRALERSETTHLAAQMLAVEQVPEGLAELLERRCSGNPLFVSEYLSTAVALGILARNDGVWTAPGHNYAELPLPLSIRELLERRIGVLDRDSTHLAQCVAVVGDGWSAPWIVALSDLEWRDADVALTALVRHRILSIGAGGKLAFTHNQLRHAAYGTLAREARAELHRRHAERLQETGSGTDAALAHHYGHADRNVIAQVHLLAAARSAKAKLAQEDAIRLYGWYVAAMDPDNPEAVDASLELSHSLMAAGRTSDALPHDQRAAELCRRQGNRTGEANAIQSQAMAHLHRGEHDRARSLMAEGLAICEEIGDRRGVMLVEYRLWWLENNLGRLEAALDRIKRAEAIALELDDALWVARTRSIRGQNLLYLGRVDEAATLLERALATLIEVGETELYPAQAILGMAYAQLGEPEKALPMMDKALDNARTLGKKGALLNLASAEAYRRVSIGKIPSARVLAEELAELAELEGARIGHIARGAAASFLALHDGDRELAIQEFETAREIMESHGIQAWAMNLAVHQLMLYRRCGYPAAALQAVIAEHREKVDDAEDEARCSFTCEEGHAALVAGQPAMPLFREAATLVAHKGIDRSHRSIVGWALARLYRAIESDQPLVCGELPADLPPALRALAQRR